MDPLITSLLEHGSTGLIAAIMLWLYIRSQAELSKERAARTDDAKEYLETVLSQNDKIHQAIERLEALVQRKG